MSKSKLTIEMLSKAIEKVAKKGGSYAMPIISYKASSMLKRILELEPNFRFSFESEIWLKANRLGLK